jgi:hypothetical protein
MTDLPDISPNLGLPFYQTKQNEFEVQHNEALLMLDALAMLSVIDRDLTAPPASPALGDRYLVKPTGTGDFAGKDNRIAQYDTGGWNFYAPKTGWTCYVQDEELLLVWDGDSWERAIDAMAGVTEIQNLSLLGIGTTADATNPLSAKLNTVLFTAKTVAESGDGHLRYKLSKESAAKTLSFLFQDNFSGRAEIGLIGDDDFHFKVSPDGSSWTDALLLDKTTGGAKLNSAVFLAGDLSPSQITADQNDYNPTGLSGASTLRLSSDASRNITGLSGGSDGRVISLLNVGANGIVLKDASASSAAANRFDLGADMTIAAKKTALPWYDATDSRWKQIASPGSAGGGPSGPLTWLATLTASNSATLDDTTHITSAYDIYEFVHENVLPATNGVNLVANVTENGGASWSADLAIAGVANIGNAANYGVSGRTLFLNPNSAVYKYLKSVDCIYWTSAGALTSSNINAVYSATTNVLNGIRFKFSSGNLASGKIHIYGRKTS